MKRLFLIVALLFSVNLIIWSQEESRPQGKIVDVFRSEHPTMLVVKMEITNIYSIKLPLVLNEQRALKASQLAEDGDEDKWKAEWDTITKNQQSMYRQLKHPKEAHYGDLVEGYILYAVDYYTREQDTVYMINTGDDDIPFREYQSYINEWKQHSLFLDKAWSDQYQILLSKQR